MARVDELSLGSWSSEHTIFIVDVRTNSQVSRLVSSLISRKPESITKTISELNAVSSLQCSYLHPVTGQFPVNNLVCVTFAVHARSKCPCKK